MSEEYSCLMSVYKSEDPSNFATSIKSMECQTIGPSEYVLMVDGPIGPELESVIADFGNDVGEKLKVYRFSENQGLHEALRVGVEKCSFDIVARMDTDDYSDPRRMEKQLEYLANNPDCDAVGCMVDEFVGSIDNVVAHVQLPVSHQEISEFAKRRNPCRHPAMTMRRQAILAAGNYRSMPYFEDYDLFIRMLYRGSRFHNLSETLVFMRVNDAFYHRRGGIEYLNYMVAFRRFMKEIGFVGNAEYLASVVPHAIVCLLPNGLRDSVYRKLLRR